MTVCGVSEGFCAICRITEQGAKNVVIGHFPTAVQPPPSRYPFTPRIHSCDAAPSAAWGRMGC
jgi:hypothetical protein